MAKFFWDLKHGRSHAQKTGRPERLLLLKDALARQNMFYGQKVAGSEYNFLLFVEHYKTYAITQSDVKKMQALGDNAGLLRKDTLPADLYVVEDTRGGSITYHGPGQLVCYMILDLDELGILPLALNRIMEDTIIEALAKYGIKSHRKPDDFPDAAGGVWVTLPDGALKKIASRGLWAKKNDATGRRITKHGFALNVHTDLSYFDHIYPCGLDIQMTSMQQLTGKKYPLHEIAPMVAEILIRRLREASEEACEIKKAS